MHANLPGLHRLYNLSKNLILCKLEDRTATTTTGGVAKCNTGISQDGMYSGTYRREGCILREVRTEGRYVPVASYLIGGP